MNDVARLLSWFEEGRLLRPSPEQPATPHLGRAIASLCGAAIELDEPCTLLRDAIGPSDHYVVVLADGLGMNLVEALPVDAFFRRRLAMEIRSVYPSSTAPALTSFATGRWPNQHAVPGWWTYLPDPGLSTTILPFVERYEQQPLGDLGVSPRQAFPEPVLGGRMSYEMAAMMPDKIADSTYTRYVTGGCDIASYQQLEDAVPVVASRIEQASSPTYTYFYIPIVDTLEHLHGPQSDDVWSAVQQVQEVVADLSQRLGGRARIVVTADHGLVCVPDAARHGYERDARMLALLEVPPTCEPRAPAFHLRDGVACDEFAAMFHDQYGEWFALVGAADAQDLELFGPREPSQEARRRLGDFLAVARGADVLVDATQEPMAGYHGGLLPDEVRIPLILA